MRWVSHLTPPPPFEALVQSSTGAPIKLDVSEWTAVRIRFYILFGAQHDDDHLHFVPQSAMAMVRQVREVVTSDRVTWDKKRFSDSGSEVSKERSMSGDECPAPKFYFSDKWSPGDRVTG